jgi:hypothetical protein
VGEGGGQELESRFAFLSDFTHAALSSTIFASSLVDEFDVLICFSTVFASTAAPTIIWSTIQT